MRPRIRLTISVVAILVTVLVIALLVADTDRQTGSHTSGTVGSDAFGPRFEPSADVGRYVGLHFAHPLEIDTGGFSIGDVRIRWRSERLGALRGSERKPGVSHYYGPRDDGPERLHVPHFGSVRQSIDRGDIVYRTSGSQLEFDVVVASGAEPSGPLLELSDGVKARSDASGGLELVHDDGRLAFQKPFAYQTIDGETREVSAKYALYAGAVGFEVGSYDRSFPLVIDPVIVSLAPLAGIDSDISFISRDAAGNIYLAGQGTLHDWFLAKLEPTTGQLLFYTTMPTISFVTDLAADPQGRLVVVGAPNTNFATTAGATIPAPGTPSDNGFYLVLSPSGTVNYATLLNAHSMGAVAIGGDGDAHVAGMASSPEGGLELFVEKRSVDGGVLVFRSTRLGTAVPFDIDVDAIGASYVTGVTPSVGHLAITPGAYQTMHGGHGDGFVAKLDPTGTSWEYVTLLGGSLNDHPWSISVGSDFRAHVASFTWSADAPVLNAIQPTYGGNQDFHIAALSPAGDALVYATYFGDGGGEAVPTVHESCGGSIVVVGSVTSGGLATPSAPQQTIQGPSDLVILDLASDGSRIASTYAGTPASDRAWDMDVDERGNLAIAGQVVHGGGAPAAGVVFLETRACGSIDPNDGNPCTRDCCDGVSGQISNPALPDGTPCQQDVCNVGVCQNGACANHVPVDVDDGNPCTSDSCLLPFGPQHLSVSGTCGTGNFCDGAGQCIAGTCLFVTPPNVDDGDPCTYDYCDRGSEQILHVPVTGPVCGDPELCEVCVEGMCVPLTSGEVVQSNECSETVCTDIGVQTLNHDGAICVGEDALGCFTNGTCQDAECVAPLEGREACHEN